ncbi:MAG TPA: hypothetical protein DCS67_10305 [Clostridiales bacterium UBA8960]|nr:hypothetical protein [Clostridiales bacterium UBA8960]
MDYSRKILPPSYDVVFKAIFGREENKPLIISLLSSILNLDVHEFEDLMILNNEIPITRFDEKGTRLDLRLKLKNKTEIDVEIQSYNHAAFSERVLYYWSKLYNSSLIKGDEYKALNKCISIIFLDFRLYDTPSMHSVFRIYETQRHTLFSDHLEIHMIELPKIEAYNKDIDNPLLVRWMEFLNVRSEHDMAELKSKDNLPEEILVALEELDKLSQDPNMREQALNMEMWIRDQIVLLNMAKNAESEGIEKGIVKGIKLTAKKMKDRGMETDIIVDITGLDFETIEKL